MPATPVWFGALEVLLNRGLSTSAEARGIALELESTAVRVSIDGLRPLCIGVQGGHLALTVGAATDPVNATIAGSPLALLQLAGFRGGVAPRKTAQVSGDAEIANAYRLLLVAALPDWEEELARLVGDPAARRLSRWALHTAAWATKARATARQNIAEYLQEESRDLVARPQVEEFLQGVDAVRDTADRVAARIARLEQRLKAGP